MRITYEHELEELNKCLRDMAMMVEKAIEQTFVAFEDQNYTMAEDVIKGDRNVNDMERAIESRCLSLILRQQMCIRDRHEAQFTYNGVYYHLLGKMSQEEFDRMLEKIQF